MPGNPRVYLAGPDVFLPEPQARGEALKTICAAQGLQGVFPLDEPHVPGTVPPPAELPRWHQISLANEAHIRDAQAVIANLTPFRGQWADTGTVYEVGFSRGLGLPVFGWSALGTTLRQRLGGTTVDADGLEVEDFGLAENLMIPGGIVSSGGLFLAETLADPWADLSLFTRCVAAAAKLLAG